MKTVTSADGTTIAYDRLGDGPPVVVVGGAAADRARDGPRPAEALAAHHRAQRRHRWGPWRQPGCTAPYAVAREVEDLAALIAVAGGSAALYGHSSGAALALHAAAAGLPVERLVMHEAPYGLVGNRVRRRAPRRPKLAALLGAGAAATRSHASGP